MLNDFQFSIKLFALVSGLGFFTMMICYFKSGPHRAGDGFMQIAAVLSAAVHLVPFLAAKETEPLRCCICLTLLLASNGLFWSACIAHGKKRPGAIFGGKIPDAIVRSGPYRIIRHPFYLAYVIGFVALSVFSLCWWLYLVDVAMFFLYDTAARKEEDLLSGSPVLGQAYTSYKSTNWRWIPFVR